MVNCMATEDHKKLVDAFAIHFFEPLLELSYSFCVFRVNVVRSMSCVYQLYVVVVNDDINNVP